MPLPSESLPSNVKELKQLVGVPRTKLAITYSPYLMHLLNYMVEDFHYTWADAISSHKFTLIIAPRGHGKSTLLELYCLQRIIENPNIRILIVSNTAKMAIDFMSVIKGWFENTEFQVYFGDYTNKQVKWTTTELMVKGRKKIMRESTLSASSYGGAIISRHVDLLICDDIIDEENARTETQRDMTTTWFYKTLMPVLEPHAKVVITGTRWHYADLYGELMDVRKHPEYHVVWNRAVDDPVFDAEGKLVGGKYLSKRWKLDLLEEKRSQMGTIFWNCQYQNDPSGYRGSMCEYDWFQWYSECPSSLRVYMGVDPAASESARADYFAVVVIGIDNSGRIYVLDVIRRQISLQDQINLLWQKFQQWRPIIVGIETNAYQKVLAQWMESMSVPVQEISSSDNKVVRFLRIQPYIQNKRVFVRKDMEDVLVQELLQFPKGRYDDVVDALGFAIESSLGGTYVINMEEEKNMFNRASVGAGFNPEVQGREYLSA